VGVRRVAWEGLHHLRTVAVHILAWKAVPATLGWRIVSRLYMAGTN
jgi:hypothetical protein